MQRIVPFLWFDDQAEEAAKLYTSVFPNSEIVKVTRYDKASAQASGRQEGSVMTVDFRLDGQQFAALNGGPAFPFNEAVSFVVHCSSQEELDHYWNRLSEGGDEKAQQCGWLKDRFGVSWQIVPNVLEEMLQNGDAARSQRVTEAMLRMKKLDIDELKRAYGR